MRSLRARRLEAPTCSVIARTVRSSVPAHTIRSVNDSSQGAAERIWRSVLADPRGALEKKLTPGDLNTLVLALEAASRRKANPAEPVHLAACHRVIRAQAFQGEGLFQHFRLFALVSSARDRGSGLTEADMLATHLRYWIDAVAAVVPNAGVAVEFSPFDSAVPEERFNDTVLDALQPLPGHVSVSLDPTRQRARRYYGAGAIRIDVDGTEIGDGGFTDWNADAAHSG